MLISSQLMNFAVYYRIGDNGVYYGFKFGKKIEWCYDFPFNLGLRHPQYISSIFLLWGLGLLICDKPSFNAGLLPLLISWTGMYSMIAMKEENVDKNIIQDKEQEKDIKQD